METEIDNLTKKLGKKADEAIGKLSTIVKNRRFKKLNEVQSQAPEFYLK